MSLSSLANVNWSYGGRSPSHLQAAEPRVPVIERKLGVGELHLGAFLAPDLSHQHLVLLLHVFPHAHAHAAEQLHLHHPCERDYTSGASATPTVIEGERERREREEE